MAYELTWNARSSSIDETNHIYYPELFRFLDDGIEALLQEIGYPLSELILQRGQALPIVHAEADYHSPIKFGDKVLCEIDPEPSESSVRFQGSGTVEGDKVFTATIVRVFVDTDSFNKQPLPEQLRDRLDKI